MTSAELLSLWSGAWDGAGWGPAWKSAFDGLSAEQAATKPGLPPDAPPAKRERVHSVWQILHHIVFWRETVVAGFDGRRPSEEEIARRNWEEPVEVSEAAWSAAKERYAVSHRLLAEAIGRSDETAKKLVEMLPHDAYHIGQVFSARALLNA